MSGELADATIDRAPTSRRRLQVSLPAVSFVTSTAVWVLVLVGVIRFRYDLSTIDDAARDRRVTAWFGVAALALLIAIVAGLVYLVDHRRRRNFYPRGYRAPQKARYTVVEVLVALILLVYTAAVGWSAAQLGILAYRTRGFERLPSPAEMVFIAAVAVVYIYHLFVLPSAGLTFLMSRRHTRRYPDETMREGPGFGRTATALMVANALCFVALTAVEGSVAAGLLPT
jgi:amino acid transporter